MNDSLGRLLDLDQLQWGAENVSFRFAHDVPIWAWTGIVLVLVLFSVWSYSRIPGHRMLRGTLACVRALLLIVLVVLLAQPQLVERTEHTERDWVVVLVDRSASMQLPDVESGAERIMRDAQLRAAIEASRPMWEQLQEDRTVVWLGFDQYAFDLGMQEDGVVLGEPDGLRTNLASALDTALQRSVARPLAGVVVMSDGRTLEAPSRAAIRRLQKERVPVFVLPLGSADPIDDLAIREVVVPESAFVEDITPVRVRVSRTRGEGESIASVRLVDPLTGDVLDEQRIVWGAGELEHELTLVQQSDTPGEREWLVELVPVGDDLVAGNNVQKVQVDIVDRPLRVLYVDGYPRWEQRYLKNLLLREESIQSSNLLLAPNRRYLQDSDEELYSLPVSVEDWAQFDVVVLGDVSSEVFSREQLSSLKEHVATRGGGLVWIGGPGSTPRTWRTSALSDLLPFFGSPSAVQPDTTPVVMTPTPSSLDLGVLRLGDVQEPWPAELSDAQVGWSVLRWSQRIDASALKPAAVPLAMARQVIGEDSWPVVVSMRYGSGRVVYVGTDEIWRWRFGRGELLPERFWLQLIRMVGRQSIAHGDNQAVLDVQPARAMVQQPVRFRVTVLDQSLLDTIPSAMTLDLTERAAPGEREQGRVEIELRRESQDSREFVGTWIPTQPGVWDVRAGGVLLRGVELESVVEVAHPDDELRDPWTDHALLASLSSETGGRVLDEVSLSELPTLLPNRQQRLIHEESEPLWDTPIALLAVLVLLTVEWVGRRLIRLV